MFSTTELKLNASLYPNIKQQVQYSYLKHPIKNTTLKQRKTYLNSSLTKRNLIVSSSSSSSDVNVNEKENLRQQEIAENGDLSFPYDNHTFKWKDYNINYITAGCGEPILLVHGFGLSLKHYRKTIPVLAEKYKVYAIDLLGFGKSDKANIQYTLEIWKELIVDFVKENIDKPVVLIGNSIGSLVSAMATSELKDENIKGLVFLNCAGGMNNKLLSNDFRVILAMPIFYLIDFLLKIKPIANFLFKKIANKENLKEILSSVYSNTESVDDELVDSVYEPSQDKGALDVFISVITGPPGEGPLRFIKDSNIPLLVLWGSNDKLTPIDGENPKFLSSVNRPNVKFVKLEGVGHCLHDDRPDLVHEQLLPWLEALYKA